jgi:phosphatidate cytidylyltransferase
MARRVFRDTRRSTRRRRRRTGRAYAPGPAAGGERRRPGRAERDDDTGARIRAAIPAIGFAIAIVVLGGIWFALGLLLLGIVAMHELYGLMRRGRPIDLAGFLALAAMLAAALFGGRAAVLVALVASLPVTFTLAVARRRRQDVAWSIAATTLGIMWIGLALAHAVLLRELDHGGALVTDVLIGTFAGDTAAYFAGRAWGRRRLAPRISPFKTLEGLLAGIVGGTLAFWGFAIAYQDWFSGADALLIGFCVALAAPLGDLFESLVKRDLEAKDTGRMFGAHGGALDRLDAVLFTAVAGYYATIAVL